LRSWKAQQYEQSPSVEVALNDPIQSELISIQERLREKVRAPFQAKIAELQAELGLRSEQLSKLEQQLAAQSEQYQFLQQEHERKKRDILERDLAAKTAGELVAAQAMQIEQLKNQLQQLEHLQLEWQKASDAQLDALETQQSALAKIHQEKLAAIKGHYQSELTTSRQYQESQRHDYIVQIDKLQTDCKLLKQTTTYQMQQIAILESKVKSQAQQQQLADQFNLAIDSLKTELQASDQNLVAQVGTIVASQQSLLQSLQQVKPSSNRASQ
jgi:chromosome segregation protein